MPLSSTVISDLKKKCVQAKKKELSFYFFLKADNNEPALVIGLPSEARKAKTQIVADHRKPPAARGFVRKSATGGLEFELLKGKPAPLKKALRSTFSGICLLYTSPSPRDDR